MPRPGGGATDELTPREQEVLALVARRLSNAEIAEQLVVSVRTVETHVSALLRKLQLPDRRALARRASDPDGGLGPPGGGSPSAASMRRHGALPVALTSFVGRTSELAALLDAVGAHRLVTATGPGGVGKTRLALAAAAELASRGDVVVANLVEVNDPGEVAAAVADALDLPAAAGDREPALLAAMSALECVLVLDNCEHLVEAAGTLVERILTACPGVRILATSRVRLMLPAEHVVPVPGLSLGDDESWGDAPTLFEARMVSAGAPRPEAADERAMVRQLCEALDGMALAIELAAARAPSIGLDGLVDALDERLAVLAAGPRIEDRHRSLRAAIAWSYDLLDPGDRRIFRAAALFAAPMTVDAVCAVAGVSRAAALDAMGRLVDWNLASLQGTPTRYRILETIRQFAAEVSADAGELPALRAAHSAWCTERLETLLAMAPGDDAWCDEVDAELADARLAMHWFLEEGAPPAGAVELADLLAAVEFQRGNPRESRRRYEEAARWSPTEQGRHDRLVLAAWAAAVGNVGADAVALLERAASVAGAAEDHAAEAIALANAAAILWRFSGLVGHPVANERPTELLERARLASDGSPRAEAAIAVAAAWDVDATVRSSRAADEALATARTAEDPILISSALDQQTVVALDRDDLAAALDAIDTRLDLLATVRVDTVAGLEWYDARRMACQLTVAAGRLAEARRQADELAALPWFREERHLSMARHLEVDLLTGDPFDEHAEWFERDWVRSGRPVASNLAVGTYAAATAYGMRGEPDRRAHWIEITRAVMPPTRTYLEDAGGFAPVFDGLLALDRGAPHAALDRMSAGPDDAGAWVNPNRRSWRPWYAAIWGEAIVLANHPSAGHRLEVAVRASAGNAVAMLICERARALLDRRSADVEALAPRFLDAGSRYQAARCQALVAGG